MQHWAPLACALLHPEALCSCDAGVVLMFITGTQTQQAGVQRCTGKLATSVPSPSGSLQPNAGA